MNISVIFRSHCINLFVFGHISHIYIYIYILKHGGQECIQSSVFFCSQVPLAPRLVLTHYGLQGITAKDGIMLFLTRPPKMTDSDYALALYVLLSRPRQLRDETG